MELPNKKYNIIYADPPWTFSTWSEKEQRKASNHYDVMKPEDIYNLPVNEITEDNSYLFIWVTYPNLLEGLETIKRWGFKYKTCGFSWIKKNKKTDSIFWGMGYYTRANNEICLLATKGKPKRFSRSVHQVVIEKIRKHSQKPDCVRDRIVDLCGDLPRIELFARNTTPGWDVWGNEV